MGLPFNLSAFSGLSRYKKNVLPEPPNFKETREPEEKAEVIPLRPAKITSQHMIPEGTVVSDKGDLMLDNQRRAWSVLIKSPYFSEDEKQEIKLLVADGKQGDPQTADTIQRVTKAGFRCTVLLASDEIIKICYERNSHVASDTSLDTDIEQTIREIISAAIKGRASDIHIESRTGHVEVFFRVDGTRIKYLEMSRKTGEAVARVMYTVQGDDQGKKVTWEKNKISEAIVPIRLDDNSLIQLRYCSTSIYPGDNFHVVLRILYQKDAPSLDELGYTTDQQGMIDEISCGARGVVIFTGKTNSGKSTSMQACIKLEFDRRGNTIKVITVESPVEVMIAGACQISINDHDEQAYANALKSTVRQDPDILVIGEIRDAETALIAKTIAHTGVKTFTTLHAGSALEVYERLATLGIPYAEMTAPGFISGIVAQRLLARTCKHCALSYEEAKQAGKISNRLADRLERTVNFSDKNLNVMFKGDGCSHCNNGTAGRIVVCEVMIPSNTILEALRSQNLPLAYKLWRDENNVTLLQDALHKMQQGIICPMEIEREIGYLDTEK